MTKGGSDSGHGTSNSQGSQHNGGPGPVEIIITGVPLNPEHQLLMP